MMRSGFTTGTCAAAAAKGGAAMLALQSTLDEISIALPSGAMVSFKLQGQWFTDCEAGCFVIKDAGDDPDITNGAELHATVSYSELITDGHIRETGIIIEGGIGIGRVTKPGLAVPPGEWAINPVPRRMIEQGVGDVISEFKIQNSKFKIVISIPDGEDRAKKTLNARLGILGGLSILGTSGIVIPISAKAWTDTIDAALDVAKASGCRTVVLSTGRSSEMAAQKELADLPEEGWIMMGDHIAHALSACLARGFSQPFIACQFAKLLKIACGHPNTHAAASTLDLQQLAEWGAKESLPPEITELISGANSAREVAVATSFNPALIRILYARTISACAKHAPGITAVPMLCGYDGGTVKLHKF